ncbi:unnamed protein product [Schistosoma spindalis]|nr:unnamed protein product [Schistosoma spindale]
MIDLPFLCRNEQCMNNNTNTIGNGNSSINTNSYRDTILHSNISPLLKHELPKQELNEPYIKKKCQYQPKSSSSSITFNHSFKLNQNYNKNKLDNLIEHSTNIQQINNQLKCNYIHNELNTINNPIIYYSNLTTNYQKYKNIYKTLWNNQHKRIYTLKSIKYKNKNSKNVLKSINKLNKNNLINLKSKLTKNEYFNKNLSYKYINPIHKTAQIKTRKIENFLHRTVNTTTTTTNNNNSNSSDNNNQGGDNLHNKIFESINTIYSNHAFNPLKTSITNQNNNFENKINDILMPITSLNEINQIVHCSDLLKKNNYLSSSSISLSSSGSSSTLTLTLPSLSTVLPIKSLYDNEKLYLKQNSIKKHLQKLTSSIFNYNYISNPVYSNSYYSINNDKPLDLRNPLQIHLNTMLCKNKSHNNNSNNNNSYGNSNNNTDDKLFNEIEKLNKLYLSMGNFNSNEIWSTIFTLLNRKLNQFSQLNQKSDITKLDYTMETCNDLGYSP